MKKRVILNDIGMDDIYRIEISDDCIKFLDWLKDKGLITDDIEVTIVDNDGWEEI